jgi:uncharacterized protein
VSRQELPPSLGGPDPRARSAFGRVRRRVGFAFLALAALLTAWSLRPVSIDVGGPTTSVCGPGTPAGAAAVSLPREHPDAWEPLVGRVVCFPDELIVTEVFELGRRGDLLLADDRLFADGTGLEVDEPARHLVRLSSRDRPIDDWPLPWGLEVGTIRVGDAVAGVAGELGRDGTGGYAVVPTVTPSFTVRNPRPDLPPEVGGDVRVAAFNVFNYFVTLGARGARDAVELERQTHKLVAALVPLDADLLALVEVENDDGSALAALATALNGALAAAGAPRRYQGAPYAEGGAGSDDIRQSFLYDPARLELVAVDADDDPIHLRPPQAITFRASPGGRAFTVIAVHHRSKSSCPTAGDVDAGYGCWNLRRTAQSEAVARFADRLAEATGSGDVLVLGDLNAHRFEPPVTLFEQDAAGAPPAWEVLTDRIPPREAYSYVYRGRSAALDHAIASGGLAERVTGLTYWAINADEPPVADYRTLLNPAGAYRPDAFRSSDHDPVLVGLSVVDGPPGDGPPGDGPPGDGPPGGAPR